MSMRAALASFCLVVGCSAGAAFADEPMQVVQIPGIKDAELRSYRSPVGCPGRLSLIRTGA